MNNKFSIRPALLCFMTLFLCAATDAGVSQKPGCEPPSDFDARLKAAGARAVSLVQREAANQLKARAPRAGVDFNRATAAARFVSVAGGFPIGLDGEGGSVSKAVSAGIAKLEPPRATKTHLYEKI